jgi:hypothetical protein
MKTLLIKDFVVENISVGEPGSAAPSGYEYVVVADDFAAGVGWTWDGATATDPTPPLTPEVVPNWYDFNTAFLSDVDWLALAPQLPFDIRVAIAASAGSGDAVSLMGACRMGISFLINQGVVIDPEIFNRWQLVAGEYDIPVNFLALLEP